MTTKTYQSWYGMNNNVHVTVIWEALDIIDSHMIGMEADAGFDAGEFSGPGHWDMIDEAHEDLAERHGLCIQNLECAMNLFIN